MGASATPTSRSTVSRPFSSCAAPRSGSGSQGLGGIGRGQGLQWRIGDDGKASFLWEECFLACFLLLLLFLESSPDTVVVPASPEGHRSHRGLAKADGEQGDDFIFTPVAKMHFRPQIS